MAELGVEEDQGASVLQSGYRSLGQTYLQSVTCPDEIALVHTRELLSSACVELFERTSTPDSMRKHLKPLTPAFTRGTRCSSFPE